jgi:hypothetical protein
MYGVWTPNYVAKKASGKEYPRYHKKRRLKGAIK